MSDRLIKLLSDWSVERRGPILAVFVLLSVVFGIGVFRLRVDSSPDALVSSVPGHLETEKRFKENFGGSSTALVVVTQAKDVTAPDLIDFQLRLAGEVGKVDGVLSVSSPAPLLALLGQQAAATGVALGELPLPPGIVPVLVSEDRTTSATTLQFDGEKAHDQKTRMELLSRVRAATQRVSAPPGTELHLGGVPVLSEAILKKLERDQLTLNPAMMIVCLLVLALTFRWWPAVVAPLLAVGIAALAVVGSLGHLGIPLTILTNIIPPLLIIVGMSDSVHLLGRYVEELRSTSSRVEAGRRAARAMMVACFLTSLTTALGFGSLASAHTEELVRFGIAAAAGVMAAYIATVLVVPSFVTLVAPPPLRSTDPKKRGFIDRCVIWFTVPALRRARLMAVLCVCFAVVLTWGATRITVDARLMDAFEEHEDVVQVTRLLEDKLAGIRPLDVMVEARSGTVWDENVVRHVQEVATWAKEQEGVLAVMSYADFGPEQQAMQAALGAQAGQVTRSATPDGKAGKLTVFFADAGVRRTLDVHAELDDKLRRQSPAGLAFSYSGEAYTGSIGRDHVLRDLVSGLGGAVVIIIGILMVLFRSVRLGLVAIPPNVIPLMATAAYMMARGIHLNMATVITFSIGIGLAVDDTVHIMARYREEIARVSSVRVALFRAALGTGRPIVVTGLSLALGFSVLLLSEFVSVRHFGELIAITVIFCLLAALWFQPALLSLVMQKRRTRV